MTIEDITPRTAAEELYGYAGSMRYPSGTKGIARAALSALRAGEIDKDEFGQVFDIMHRRKQDLLADRRAVSDRAAIDANSDSLMPGMNQTKEWSPSDILDKIPPASDEPDHMERQLPPLDR